MPTIIGGIFGAIAAVLMPNLYLKPVLLISILTMSILILVKPEIMAPAPGTPILSPTKHLGAGGVYLPLESMWDLCKLVLVLYC